MSELIANRFEVLQPLGSGGLSDVSLVRDRRDGSSRALKRLRQDDAESVERFQSEFAELAALAHPNIVRVHEYGALDDGGRWIAMEAIEGRPADQAVRPGDVAGALRVALDAIAGLDALHAAGRFHGDIKPSNILVEGSRAVLIDFGFMGRESEMPGGRRRGTPGYLAPEVLRGAAPYGRASDAYALGATLYRILSGRPAFPGRDAAAILAAQVRGVPSLQPLENAGVPRALADLVAQLLTEDPSGRSAALEDLRELARRRLARKDGTVPHAVLATSGPLVGRDNERRALGAHLLEGAGAGTGGGGGGGRLRIALLAGPVGSGRTRLAHEIAIEAELAGWTLEWHDLKTLPRETEPTAAAATQLAGSARDDVEGAHVRGALYVLDDVDEWPERVLERFRVATSARPTAILAIARSESLEGQPFLRWSLSVTEDVAPRVFGLGPLEHGACEDLVRTRLGGTLPAGLAEAVARESSGNPGSAANLVGRLVELGSLRRSGNEWTLAPGESVAARVREAASASSASLFDDLSVGARQVLLSISGWSEAVEIDQVAARAGLSHESITAAIDELEWRGIVGRADGRLSVLSPSIERLAIETLQGDDVATVRARLIGDLEPVSTASDPGQRQLLLGSHRWALGDRREAIAAWQHAWQAPK